jgi:predicted nuclease of predicted toxin-antitoxin system
MSSRALLLDENLSPSLPAKLEPDFPGIVHVSQFNLRGMPDIEIWRFAGEHGYCIVSSDSDFNELAFVQGPPQQVIWLRLGEATTDDVRLCLLHHAAAITAFLNQDDDTVLELAKP